MWSLLHPSSSSFQATEEVVYPTSIRDTQPAILRGYGQQHWQHPRPSADSQIGCDSQCLTASIANTFPDQFCGIILAVVSVAAHFLSLILQHALCCGELPNISYRTQSAAMIAQVFSSQLSSLIPSCPCQVGPHCFLIHSQNIPEKPIILWKCHLTFFIHFFSQQNTLLRVLCLSFLSLVFVPSLISFFFHCTAWHVGS